MPGEKVMIKWKKEKHLGGMKEERERRGSNDFQQQPTPVRQKRILTESKLQMAIMQPPKFAKADPRFKEIRNELARRSRRKREKDEEFTQELYVDAYRMVSVQLGGTFADLKQLIQQSGIRMNLTDLHPGEPNDVMFIKQANYFVGRHDYENALFYVNLALEANPESKVLN